MYHHLVFQDAKRNCFSTTKEEFIALSEGLRTAILLIRLLEEMQEKGLGVLRGKQK